LFDFSTVHDRRRWSATKWLKYTDRDLIPLWIADMDFPVAPPIQAAVAEHVAHGNFGYMSLPPDLPQLLVEDHRRRYDWTVDPEWIVWLPGLVLGINLAVRACCAPHESAISFSPVYPPFLKAPGIQGRGLLEVPLRAEANLRRQAIDFERLEALLPAPPRGSLAATSAASGEQRAARLLLLCHPHNPTGSVFTRAELDRLAAVCEQHDLLVCSDEVHCDLILDESLQHVPFARIMAERSPRLLARTITLNGPGKTYNIAGLGIAWAIVPDGTLRQRFVAAMQELVPDPCCFAFTAARAAFLDGEPWRQALLAQLRSNRDLVSAALDRMQLPHSHPQATFLTWIDARALAASVGNAATWFAEHGVGLSDGADFGQPGYLRLNFAAPPSLLQEALQRMQQALAAQRPACVGAQPVSA